MAEIERFTVDKIRRVLEVEGPIRPIPIKDGAACTSWAMGDAIFAANQAGRQGYKVVRYDYLHEPAIQYGIIRLYLERES
jgi:hypothetical protein